MTPSPPRKIFEVLIGDTLRSVYDIEQKEHDGANGEIKTWWIYLGEKLPDGVTPPLDSSDLHPWHKWILRQCWDLRFKDRNTTKVKWDDMRFSHHTSCEMHCNGVHIYSFTCGEMSFAIAKAQYLQAVMSEHSYNFFDAKSNEGRRIRYHNLPAFVRVNGYHPGEIGIVPDYGAMPKEEWWKEYRRRTLRTDNMEDLKMDEERIQEYEEGNYINHGDALADGNIWWFRD